MNGKEIEAVTDTFRYEFKQAIDPLIDQVKVVVQEVKEQGKQTAVNKESIDTIKGDIKTISGRVWALVIGVPSVLIALIGLVYKFSSP